MKTCSKCNNIKEKSQFSKDKSKKDLLHTICKICKKQTDIKYKKLNYNKIIIKKREHYYKNRQYYLFKRRLWSKLNRGRKNQTEAAREASKKQQTPKWLTKQEIYEMNMIYSFCNWLNNWKLEKYHVDHIIPINGKSVRGLHVPWNLQIITALDNIKKGNKQCLQ